MPIQQALVFGSKTRDLATQRNCSSVIEQPKSTSRRLQKTGGCSGKVLFDRRKDFLGYRERIQRQAPWILIMVLLHLIRIYKAPKHQGCGSEPRPRLFLLRIHTASRDLFSRVIVGLRGVCNPTSASTRSRGRQLQPRREWVATQTPSRWFTRLRWCQLSKCRINWN